MHVILGLLGTVVTILYLLSRLSDMGINLGGLNPFYWRRRRAWAKKYQGDPIYSVEDPMHVAAILIVGAAKLDGDLTSEQKKAAIHAFREKFSLETKGASDLLGSAAHLLGAPQVVVTQLDGVADRNRKRFSSEQVESLLEMIVDVAGAEGELSAAQKDYVDDIRARLLPEQQDSSSWN